MRKERPALPPVFVLTNGKLLAKVANESLPSLVYLSLWFQPCAHSRLHWPMHREEAIFSLTDINEQSVNVVTSSSKSGPIADLDVSSSLVSFKNSDSELDV